MEKSLTTPNFWQDRPVFVTGGSGLLGGFLVERLANAGADVTCLVRDWNPDSVLLTALERRVNLVRGDIVDQATLERVLGEYETDTVFHLAAQTVVPVANRNPISTFESNIKGTWSVLEACRRSPMVRQIVVASSDKAYGEQTILPYREDLPLQGVHPYDVSKSCADMICRSYAETYELPVTVTRCGNLFGGGDLNWNRIVPGTIRSVTRGQSPVIRSDGTLVRDYFYAEDAAAAYMCLAEQLATDRSLVGSAFNFSNEEPLSARDMVDLILDVMESDLEPEVQNYATHEIRNQFLDGTRARTQLGWQPEHTLREGLALTVGWYREFFGVASVKSLRQNHGGSRRDRRSISSSAAHPARVPSRASA